MNIDPKILLTFKMSFMTKSARFEFNAIYLFNRKRDFTSPNPYGFENIMIRFILVISTIQYKIFIKKRKKKFK
jgi:hypothetical protein